MRLKLLIAGFLALSFLLAAWLFVNWSEWSMADFDCAAGYWNCRRHLFGPMALRIGLPVIVWLGLVVLLAREWKKV